MESIIRNLSGDIPVIEDMKMIFVLNPKMCRPKIIRIGAIFVNLFSKHESLSGERTRRKNL